MKRQAFTLVEVMIVVLIIGILMAIAVPNFIQARTRSQINSCISNLHTIEGAKEQWAMDTRAGPTDTPTQSDLAGNTADHYMRNWPVCPGGGTYSIRNMSLRPLCSVTGHTL